MNKESWLDVVSVKDAKLIAERYLDEDYLISKKQDEKYGWYFEFYDLHNTIVSYMGEYGNLKQRKNDKGEFEFYDSFDGTNRVFPKKWITYVSILNRGRTINNKTYSESFNQNAQKMLEDWKKKEVARIKLIAKSQSEYFNLLSENIASKKTIKDPSMDL